MGPADLPIFRRHPGLRNGLPRYGLLPGPTPIEALALPGLRRGSLFVKRDDASTPIYGGNKPRKLEFILGAALARGSRRLLTTGGLGTHHGLATAILGREAGLETTLVLVDQPVTEEIRHSLALCDAYGAELIYGRNVPGAAAQCVRVLARGALRRERVRLVPTGGSSSVGNVGFVSAAFEIGEQIAAGVVPRPASIWVAVGSGGTQAGLVLGLRLLDLAIPVIGVLVTDILPPSPARLAHQARATLRRLRRFDPSIPGVRIGAGDFPLVRDQLGPGYGAATDAGRAAGRRARSAGLHLDPTYTEKCLAAICAHLDQPGADSGPVLFWNTYNGIDVTARSPREPDPDRLPVAIRHALRTPEPGSTHDA